ncbi:MAG: hypothetical protein J6T48_10280 [Bacteroidales bacterium]|nr:hypothetical protein [Bacteroidales bacterium]
MVQDFYSHICNINTNIINNLPCGLETTANLMLVAMEHSNDERIRDMAAFIKISKKYSGIMALFDFAMSMLRGNPIRIEEKKYDDGLSGVLEIRNHFVKKYCADEHEKNNAISSNLFFWLILELPVKDNLKSNGLVF